MKSFSRCLLLGVLVCLLVLAVGLCRGVLHRGRGRAQMAGARVRRGRPRSSDNSPARPTSPCRRTFLPPEEEDDGRDTRAAEAAGHSVGPHALADQRARARFFEPLSTRGDLTTPLYLSLHVLVI